MIDANNSNVMTNSWNPNSLRACALTIIGMLREHFDDTFDQRTFYAPTFTAAACALLSEDPSFQARLLHSYRTRGEDPTLPHEEFNSYALQEYLRVAPNAEIAEWVAQPRWHGWFVRKVSNWVLLRSLVRIRSERMSSSVMGYLQTVLILGLNRSHGWITDNTFRMWHTRHATRSSQYHAFATLLLGELAIHTRSTIIRRIFLRKLDLALSEVHENGTWYMEGRGQHQLFGYASLLLALALADSLTHNDTYATQLARIFDHLLQFQQPDGSFPLTLPLSDHLERHAYNNDYDYLAFLAFCLAKSWRVLSSNTNL